MVNGRAESSYLLSHAASALAALLSLSASFGQMHKMKFFLFSECWTVLTDYLNITGACSVSLLGPERRDARADESPGGSQHRSSPRNPEDHWEERRSRWRPLGQCTLASKLIMHALAFEAAVQRSCINHTHSCLRGLKLDHWALSTVQVILHLVG